MPDPDELALVIARQLEIDHQYVEYVEAWDVERITQVRSAGRRAGRLLGWKIITHQTEPNDEARVTVVVVVRDGPSREEQDRLHARAVVLMDEIWKGIHQPPGV